MKIHASVEMTDEEVRAIITDKLEHKFDAGRSYGKLPTGECLSLNQTDHQTWVATWGEPPEQAISPAPTPVEPPLTKAGPEQVEPQDAERQF